MLREAGDPVRGRPGRHRRHRRAGLRRHPGHAPRAGAAASRSSPATRTRPSRSRRSTGRRSPRFPGTLVFYMGVRALPRIAERLVAGGPAGRRAGRGGRARHAARPAHAARHAGRRRRAGRGGADPRAGDHARRARSRALREQLAWLEGARCTAAPSRSPARGRRRARWPRGCARSAPTWSRRRRSASSRSTPQLPDLARLRPRVRRRRRTAPTLFGARPPARRARARRRDRRRDRPGHRARAARPPASRADVVPERAVAEGLVEALGGRAVAPRAGRARRRGPRRAARRAARARRRGRRARAVRDRGRAARRRPARRRRGARTTSRSRPPPRCASSLARRRDRSTARGWPRSARPRAPRCASTAPSRDLEADPHTPDGLVDALVGRRELSVGSGAMRPITFLSDYGPADEFVGVVHARDRAASPRGAGDRPRPRDPAPRRAAGRADARARAAVRAAPACTSRSSTPRSARGGARSRCGRRDEDRLLVGPDNGLLIPAAERFGGVAEAVEISPRRGGSSRSSATFHGRDVFAPVAARLAGRRAARAAPATPLEPVDLVALDCRGRARGAARWSPTSSASTVRQRRRSTPRTPTCGAGLRLGDPVARRAPARRRRGVVRAHVRRRRAGRRCCSTRTPAARWRWPSTAATPPRARPAAGRRGPAGEPA